MNYSEMKKFIKLIHVGVGCLKFWPVKFSLNFDKILGRSPAHSSVWYFGVLMLCFASRKTSSLSSWSAPCVYGISYGCGLTAELSRLRLGGGSWIPYFCWLKFSLFVTPDVIGFWLWLQYLLGSCIFIFCWRPDQSSLGSSLNTTFWACFRRCCRFCLQFFLFMTLSLFGLELC